MDKKDFDALENNQETYDKLLAIIKTSKDFNEVFFALLKQAEILYIYEEYIRASKILINIFTEQEKLEDYYLKMLIDSLIKSEDKNALYYINIRKESLSQMEMYKYLLDLLSYKKTFKEEYYYLLETLKVYNFDKNILIPYYYLRYEEYVNFNSDLTTNAYKELKGFNLDQPTKEKVEELYFNYLLKNKFSFEEFLENNFGLSKTYFELRLLMRTEMLKRVQILEAEKEKVLDDLSLYRKEIIFKELRDFYLKHNDNRSYDLYKEKYEHVIEQIKKDSKKPKKAKLNLEPLEEIKDKKIIPLIEKPKVHITSQKVSLLENFVKELSELELNLSLFDRLRNIGILLEKYFEFTDVLFYLRPQFYHYKKERLYRKTYSVSTIENSIPGITSTTLDDIVTDVNFAFPDYDIIKDKKLTETDVKQIYSYGVTKGFSITFYQTEKKELYYDDLIFKTISSIIYYDLKYDNYITLIKDEFNFVNNLFNSEFINAFIYKDELLGTPQFKELFKLNKNDNLSSLVLKFNPELRIKYNNLLNKLKNGEIKQFEIDLYYKNKDYLVKHYFNNGYIYGLFVEVTKKVKEIELWQEKASIDPLSKLLTLYEFEKDFKETNKEKASFILIELSNLDKIESLYGKAKKREFFLEFADLAKETFSEVYLFDQTAIIATLKINDIRAVEKKVSKFSLNIKEERSKVLKEQRFNVFMGIIRYPINTKEKNINRIYQYLSLSLYKAKTIDKLKGYSYFDFKDYEQDLFDTEVIKQIDELILSEDLYLTFKQIVNYKTKSIYAYEVGISSNKLNVYEEYYYQIAEKRDLLERLEKYIIEQTFKFLKRLKEETNSYVRLVVNISSKTLNTPNFSLFLANLYRTYKIPPKVLEIKINLNRYINSEAVKIKELNDLGVIIATNNLEYINKDYLKVFHYTKKEDLFLEKTQRYLKNLNEYLEKENMVFIYYNVDNLKEIEILEKLNIYYIRGNAVDRTLSLEEVIKMLKQ